MYAIFSEGQQVGTIKDAERCIAVANSKQLPLEFRTSWGEVLGQFVPAEKLPVIPWDPTITKEELDRLHAEGGGISIDEFWKKIGVR